jgi:hypothetical protein
LIILYEDKEVSAVQPWFARKVTARSQVFQFG